MAFLIKDRVLETLTGSGTGTLTTGGAVADFRTFGAAGYANGDTFPGFILGAAGTGEWENGTYTWGTGGVITRTTVLANHLNTTAAVNFTAGTKQIAVGLNAKIITDLLAVISGSNVAVAGTISFSGTPGGSNYDIDETGRATTLLTGGTLDFLTFSGIITVCNWSSGGMATYNCSFGTVQLIGTAIGTIGGTIAVNGTGYRWTNTSGGSQTLAFHVVRLRTVS